jgi:glycosyltransferase involved in cell wall biosynthesis
VYLNDISTININTTIRSQIKGLDIVFIAWRRLSRRTSFLSKELGLELFFVSDKLPYIKAIWKTLNFLTFRKPDIVFVQLPQGPLLAEVEMTSKRIGFKVIADVHTGFIYPTSIKEYILNGLFHNYLNKVDLILAHNQLQADLIKSKISNEKIIVVYDSIPKIPQNTKEPKFNIDLSRSILFPASWALDEPLDFIAMEFLKSYVANDHILIITGNWRRNIRLYRKLRELIEKKKAKNKIILTGYIPDEEYYHILKSCKAVIAVSDKEYTLPHALWEAIAVEKPFIILNTKTMITEIGRSYPCFFTMSNDSLRKILEICLDKSYSHICKIVKSKAIELRLKSKNSIEMLIKIISEI